MFFDLVTLALGGAYYANQNNTYKKNIQKIADRGAFVKTNLELEENLLIKYYFKSKQEEFPEKYRDFFRYNGKAKWCYCNCIVNREVWKQGYRPHCFDFMPKEGYDFFSVFRQYYDKDAAKFNEEMKAKREKEALENQE